MREARWREIENLFNSACELPLSKRTAFVTDSCSGDNDLCEEVISLLAEFDKGATCFDEPVLTKGLKLLTQDGRSGDDSSSSALQENQNFGSYKILRLLKSGGMGEVYLAEDERLNRKVALKVLPSILAPNNEFNSRFEQEARAASAVKHENVAHIYELDVAFGKYFIAMEFVEGKTLRGILKSDQPLRFQPAREIALQIVNALAAAHSAGVIHRDIKPENIMVQDNNRIKVLDFGLAKWIDGVKTNGSPSLTGSNFRTTPGLLMGTTAYMSPEQIRGKDIDHRTDIWSFGVVLYEMLTGRLPFCGESPADTMSLILSEDLKDLNKLEKDYGFDITRIVRRCLNKNPAERFQSAQDLAFALEPFPQNLYSTQPFQGTALRSNTVWKRALWLSLAGIIILGTISLWTLNLQERVGTFFKSDVSTNGASRGSSTEVSEKGMPLYNQLTFQRGTIWSARFAPEGKSIIYSATFNGEKLKLFSGSLSSADSRPYNLPGGDTGNVNLLSISAKGEMALLKANQYLYQFIHRGTLAYMAVNGQSMREIAEDVQEADWSPDGANLAVIRWVNGQNQIEYPINKALYKTEGYFSNLRISPQGDEFAFLDHPKQWDNRGFVSIIDAAGNKRNLTEEWSGVEGLAWNPVSHEIWFTASKAGEAYALYATSLTRGAEKTRLVTRVPSSLMLYDISKDGEVLLAHAVQRTDILGLTGKEQKAEKNLSWMDLVGISALAADGQSFLFTHFGAGSGTNYSVYFRKTDGSAPAVRLGDGRGLALSPDGKFALVKLNVPEEQLNILPVYAGEVRKLPRSNIEFYEKGSWFPDGQRILFTGKKLGETNKRCFIQDVQSGEVKPLTPEGITGTQISPDGKTIVVSSLQGDKSLYRIDDSRLQPVRGLTTGEEVIGWSSDNKSLFVFRPFDWPLKIYKMNPESGKRALIKVINPADPAGVFGAPYVFLTPDTKTYIYGLRRYLFDLYVVSDLSH